MKYFSSTYPRYILVMLTIIGFALFPGESKAQSDPMFTQYWALPTFLNPAATGDTDFVRIRGGARLQWIGISNAPKSFVGTADSPFKLLNKRVGAGVTISQESIGLFSNLLVGAQGSYKLNLRKGRLSIGVQLAYYNSRFKGEDVYIPSDDEYHQPDDPSIPKENVSGNAFDISAAVMYTHPLFHIGVSGMHLTDPKVKLTREGDMATDTRQFETRLPRALYFDAGGNIDINNTLFTLQPSLLLASDFSDFAAQLTMRATYNKFLSLGVGYRWNDAVCIMVGAEFKNFFLGYAYDIPTSALARASAGSHEIVAGYQLKLDFSAKNNHSHKSIRIM